MKPQKIIQHIVAVLVLLMANNTAAIAHNQQLKMTDSLNKQEQQLAAIAATTATGNIAALKPTLNAGLDAGLTINQIKDVLAQMYAYAGFPRSLTGINTFMTIVDERKAKGINDEVGKEATPVDESTDKYERGRKTLEHLTGQAQTKPAKGFGEFSPTIDRFLKEHLFADIFDSDILTYRQRELATIAALASMTGVDPMLGSHLNMGMNVGLTEAELNDMFSIIENTIGKAQADNGRTVFGKVLDTRKN